MKTVCAWCGARLTARRGAHAVWVGCVPCCHLVCLSCLEEADVDGDGQALCPVCGFRTSFARSSDVSNLMSFVDAHGVAVIARAAAAGVPAALSVIATCYAYGLGVARDQEMRAEFLALAVVGGDKTAAYNMGCELKDADPQKAAQLFRSAARDVPSAMYQCAIQEMEKKNMRAATAMFRRAARAGHVPAMNMAGRCLEDTGRFSAAAYWYARGARGGDKFAHCNLARCYEAGIGVARDDARAFRLYQIAAARDFHKGLHGLAHCYGEGRGVERSLPICHDLLERAVMHGSKEAIECLAIVKLMVEKEREKK
jgi:hypothetical protein